jgi:hypothetical protein
VLADCIHQNYFSEKDWANNRDKSNHIQTPDEPHELAIENVITDFEIKPRMQTCNLLKPLIKRNHPFAILAALKSYPTLSDSDDS